MKKDPRVKRIVKDPRIKSKNLGPHDEDDEESPPTKKQFRPYGQAPSPPVIKTPPIIPAHVATSAATSARAAAAAPTEAFQLYSDGNRVYLGPAPIKPAIVATTPVRPPPPKSRPKMPQHRERKQENSANFRIYPTNAGKTLLKKPPVTKVGFDETQNETNSIIYQSFEAPPSNSEPYNPIRVPVSFIKKFEPSTLSPQITLAPPSNPSIRLPPFSNPPPKITIFPKDDECETVKIVKHAIMRHHRSGGGHDIRKLREIYGIKKGALPNSSSELLSPNHDDTQSQPEIIIEESVGQIQDTVIEHEDVQSELDNVAEKNESAEDDEDILACEIAPSSNASIEMEYVTPEIYPEFEELQRPFEEISQPPESFNAVTNEPQEPQISYVTIDEEPKQVQRKSPKRTKPAREDGELSRSPSPEIITIDDSDDDDIIVLKNPSPKSQYKGKTAFGLDLYLSNLGKPAAENSESEPVNIFFDLKLFYQDYENILRTLIQKNKERTTFAHGVIDQLCESAASLEIYFLMSGDALEESRADEEVSEIEIYIVSINEDKNVDYISLMEPLYNVIKNSNIGTVSFNSNTNVIIVIIEGENNIAIRPIDKLSWARSSLIWGCGNNVPVFKSALLLIKKAIRQFRASEDLSDFIISFALIHYFQKIEVFPIFDYDLDEIVVAIGINTTVLSQPTKKANEIFSDFLFFIKHNEELAIECPFTKEQFDIKDTSLLDTIESIFGK
uniref:Uncharacterized protein n=1 Tax=Panagrolaimus superbus TaxID=310955 RepID=A0A914Y1R4_9BILA